MGGWWEGQEKRNAGEKEVRLKVDRNEKKKKKIK